MLTPFYQEPVLEYLLPELDYNDIKELKSIDVRFNDTIHRSGILLSIFRCKDPEATKVNTTAGRIFKGKCYYDLQYEFTVHSKRCQHSGKDIIPTQEQLNTAQQEMQQLQPEIDNANAFIEELITTSRVQPEYYLPEYYVKLFRFIRIPEEYRGKYNILSDLNDDLVLCTWERGEELMGLGGWGCMYA